ncbi:hypothetical protein [Sneathiella limimaris]|uniref:hypothetical protein n=1 Tax=Sneathiella limimaris TaxID=1964213 RepID=UPI00146CFA52|nr:hypothetical protein [Sneathiella limimaris]
MRLLRTAILAGMLVLPTSLAFATYEDGLKAYNSGDFKQAATLWEELAIAGNVNAQYNLGVIYERGGQDQPKDLAVAYGWYRLAAAQKMPEAEQAVSRLQEILTSGQIEDGNKYAVTVLGQWYRQTVGLSDEDYKKIIEARAAREKAKIEAENRQAAERARRQRELIAKRDADAKLAKKLEEQSRQAAIEAARQQAEEAKRKAYLAQKQREEEERMARLRAEKKKQDERNAALQRLAELKAKQKATTQTGSTSMQSSSVTSEAAPLTSSQSTTSLQQQVPKTAVTNQPVARTSVEKTSPPKPVQSVSQAPKSAEVQADAPKTAAKQTVETRRQQATASKTTSEPAQPVKAAASEAKKEEVIASNPVVEAPKVEAKPKAAPVTETQKEKIVTPKVEEQKPATVAVLPKPKPEPKQEAPKASMPVISNGLDQGVVAQILERSESTPLDTASAKAEIAASRNDIEALKWSLISAARGKAGAKDMNERLMANMSEVQIVEANRRAADWILKRQARQ